MSDGNCLFRDVDPLLSNVIHHFYDCFIHASGLIQLTDRSFRSSSHNRLDLQCTGHQSFHSAQTSVLAQSFQILQHKKCVHLFNIFLYFTYYFFKRKSLFFTLHDLHGNQTLTTGCRFGIKYMNLFLRLLFQEQVFSKNRTVIGTTQFCR